MDNFLIREIVKSATNRNYIVISICCNQFVHSVVGKIWHSCATGTGSGVPVQLEVAILRTAPEFRDRHRTNGAAMTAQPVLWTGRLARGDNAANERGRAHLPPAGRRAGTCPPKGGPHRQTPVARIKLDSEHGDGNWRTRLVGAASAQPLSHRSIHHVTPVEGAALV